MNRLVNVQTGRTRSPLSRMYAIALPVSRVASPCPDYSSYMTVCRIVATRSAPEPSMR